MLRHPVVRTALLFVGVLSLAFGIVLVGLSIFTLVASGFNAEHLEVRTLLGGALSCVAGGLILRMHRRTYLAVAS